MNQTSPNEGSYPPSQPSQPVNQQVSIPMPVVTPLVTYAILAVTILVFGLQYLSVYLYQVDLPVVYGVKFNDAIAAGQLWRLFTPMLLHANPLHIMVNMYSLYNIGPSLERQYGHGRFLVLYILAGFTGNVLSFLLSPNQALGASTAIFGLLGAYGIFLYQNQRFFGGRARPVLIQIVILAVVNLVIGLAPGIDNWGHVGGLVGGVLFAWFAGPLLDMRGIYPSLTVVDQRETRNTIMAAGAIGAIFSLLVVVKILAMRG